MGTYFVEYGALQERTADGPKRVIETETSALGAVKISDDFAKRIADALNDAESKGKCGDTPMPDEEKQALISDVLHRKREVSSLDEWEFRELMNGFSRMFGARIWNCVDATGKNDEEWGVLSSVFARVYEALGGKV